MSKIIMDAHRTCAGQVNETKRLLYIKIENSVPMLYSDGKRVNAYVNSASKVVVTTVTATERPDLNIQPLEIKIT